MPDRYTYDPSTDTLYQGTPDNPIAETDLGTLTGGFLQTRGPYLYSEYGTKYEGPLPTTRLTDFYFYGEQGQMRVSKGLAFESFGGRANEGWGSSLTAGGDVIMPTGEVISFDITMSEVTPGNTRLAFPDSPGPGKAWEQVARNADLPVDQWGDVPAGYHWATPAEMRDKLVAAWLLTHQRELVDAYYFQGGADTWLEGLYDMVAQLTGNVQYAATQFFEVPRW